MSKNPKVYLAGPISGLTYDQCTDWRDSAKNELAKFNIDGFSPMRHKEFVREIGIIDESQGAIMDHVMCSDRGIMRRDTFDVRTADALFVNLLDTKKVSIGTIIEIAMAYDRHTPVIVVMEKHGNLHDHAMLREAICFRLPTIDEGLAVLKSLFVPG
ncbi:nucleoside 2-deoxyribosyltransferase [Candidatus Pacearchaeota archaeon]|nr:nucleoside 2-deoxyribosyltransferase [Candidatus Pacearchaeota archaeon]